MSIISKETWDKFTEEEKSEFCKLYNEILAGYQDAKKQGYVEKADEIFDRLIQLEIFFGKENLQPEPKIKTWEDVEKYKEDEDCYCCAIENALSKDYFDNKLRNKLIATYKIAKLIELGYGGMVTDEEWENEDIEKFSIVRFQKRLSYVEVLDAYEFISFHAPEQREEFMSYPENVKLIEQYYMI